MKQFAKITKKYALNNSYFKNCLPTSPQDPFEVYDYYKQHKELPYNAEITDDWLYNCFMEYQKRNKIWDDQFFTPPAVAQQLAGICDEHFDFFEIQKIDLNYRDHSPRILDLCSGFGMLSKALQDCNLLTHGLEANFDLSRLYRQYTGSYYYNQDFRDFKNDENYVYFVSNPPFTHLEDFFIKLSEIMKSPLSIAVLILPNGFMEKTRPKKLCNVLEKFTVIETQKSCEKFVHTNISTEIVVLKLN